MLCAYTGTDARSYPDYLDAGTSRMLEAVPGGTYEVAVAPGRAPGLPLPPGDGRWAATGPAAPGPLLRREPVTVPPTGPPTEPDGATASAESED